MVPFQFPNQIFKNPTHTLSLFSLTGHVKRHGQNLYTVTANSSDLKFNWNDFSSNGGEDEEVPPFK